MQNESMDQVHEPTQIVQPLAVPVKATCNLVGVGNTTMWSLIKSGRVKTTRIGRRRLVIFESLQQLLSPE